MQVEDTINNDELSLYENYRIEVDKGQSLLRIDKFLMARLEGTSRNKIQMAARANCIKVNDNAVKPNYRVKPGDVIQVFLTSPPQTIEIIPQDIPLNIVYEDEDLVVVNKPANMVVHPGYGNYTGTLLNALTFHFQDQKDKTGETPKPLLVHRIDKDTTGLLLVAKNEYSQTYLAKQFFDHTTERQYTAIVWGDFQEESGTIEGHIGRSLRDRKVMDIFPDGEHGKPAITHYNVIKRFGYISQVQCKLETGRTHQIRAHMKHIGHPLFGDKTYGGDKILKGTTFSKYKQFVDNCLQILPRQALHAATIGFTHPTTGERMSFSSELPEDMQTIINRWTTYVSGNKE
ncbi:MAG: RluA family pseudouridine synthase [Bacteroidales bacterium]|jgi:23S rRNA pseudouridine1911/1915/1917 synthase|nr:RluA family pseudouridine synthase [Bacteroidales bacterium]